jgi:hypothetical protein
MQADKKDNSGALFSNKDKPDAKSEYGGSAIIGGVDFWVNAWVKETKDGRKYFSLSFRPKQEPVKPRQQEWKAELDDDIPF